MIEPMKQAIVISLREQSEAALRALRELEVLHVRRLTERESEEFKALNLELEEANKAIQVLLPFRERPQPANAHQVLAGMRSSLEQELAQLRQDMTRLSGDQGDHEAWTQFLLERVGHLQERGLYVKLAEAGLKDLPEVPDDTVLLVLGQSGDKVCYALFSDRPVQLQVRTPNLSTILQADLKGRMAQVEQWMQILSVYAAEFGDGGPDVGSPAGAQLAKDALAVVRDNEQLYEQLERLSRERAPYQLWGDFDPKVLAELRAKGLFIAPCLAGERDLPELPEHAVLRRLSDTDDGDGLVPFVVVSDRPLTMELPLAELPGRSLAEITRDEEACRAQMHANEVRLHAMSSFMEQLEQWRDSRLERSQFVGVRDGMGQTDRLAYLTGYLPTRQGEKLLAAAREHGWAVRLTDPASDDKQVPTLLTVPKWLRVAMPIFDFVGIRPGYFEFDISAWFLVFFTIFFAIIFGDAGYGLLVSLGALALRFKGPAKMRVPANLLLLLGVSTIVWGVLTGVYFGLQPGPDFQPAFLRGLDFFTDPVHGQHNMAFFCFFLGALHLSVAHVWKFLVAMPAPISFSQLGWTLLVWANFLLGSNLVAGRAFSSTLVVGLYAIGAVLILFFTSPSWRVGGMIGSGLGALAGGAVNSFVDVLSYIRLFAVGLSGFYVAKSFNDMGMGMAEGPLGIILAIIVIVGGHLLNLALAALGVLVHGIRLNTLEFSGHIGVEWAGIAYKPFARLMRREDASSGQAGAAGPG